MDYEDRRLTVNGAMALAAAVAIGIAAWFLMPQMQQAKAAGPLFLTVTWVSLLGGAIAGVAGYGVAAVLARRWQTGKAVATAAALMAVVLTVNVSLAGWVHMVTGIAHVMRTLPHNIGHPTGFMAYRDATIKDRNAYRNELGRLRYPAFLSFKELGAPGGLKQARSKITDVRAVIQTYQDRFQQQEIDLRAGPVTTSLTAKQQREGMERLKTIMGAEFKAREDWWKATSDIAAEQDALLADLAKADGDWDIRGDRIYFHSSKDVGRFQKHANAIIALQEQAHTLDLAIAHESDKADEAMVGGGPTSETRVGWTLGGSKP